MSGRVLLTALALAVSAGCSGGSPPPPLPTTTAPGISVTRPGTPTVSVPGGTLAPPPVSTPRAQYRALVAQWQAARSAFLGLVSSGKALTLAQEQAAARTFLAAERQFAAALVPSSWPAQARGALDALRRQSVQMQSHLSDMAAADSRAAFTERLADYSVDVGRENTAVNAVDRALAR